MMDTIFSTKIKESVFITLVIMILSGLRSDSK
jgi:hypothetical protein